ncbi:hypothetical protein EMIT074MI3_50167 [Bacillus licheniformis]
MFTVHFSYSTHLYHVVTLIRSFNERNPTGHLNQIFREVAVT